MTRQSSDITTVTESSRTGQLQKPLQMKTLARLILTAFGVFLCVALAGCVTNNGKVVTINLTPNTIDVNTGTTVVLEAMPQATGQTCGWQYQWQQVIDETTNRDLITTNLPGAANDQLILKNVQADDADLYRCLIYKSGIRGETNATSVFSLEVSGAEGQALAVGTAVSGSFWPGNGSGAASCCERYKDGMIFKNPTTGNWWSPPAGCPAGKTTITDHTTHINYSSTPVYMRVLDERFTSLQCVRLPGPVEFYSMPSNAYMICLVFPGPLPQTGQQFSFTINWPTN